MKKIYLFILMIVLAMAVKAQDTVVLRNGDILSVKVTEVSNSQIKYLLWDNQNGPVYVQEVGDIFMVKYQNGRKEVFDQKKYEQKTQVQQSNQRLEKPLYIEYYDGQLCTDDRVLTVKEASQLLGYDRYNTFISGLRQYRGGGVGIGCSILLGLAGGAAVLFSGDDVLVLAGWVAVGIADILLPIGIVRRSVGKGRMNWAIDDYNREQREMSQRFSLSVGPSFGSVPTATGNNYTIGAGLQFQF